LTLWHRFGLLITFWVTFLGLCGAFDCLMQDLKDSLLFTALGDAFVMLVGVVSADASFWNM